MTALEEATDERANPAGRPGPVRRLLQRCLPDRLARACGLELRDAERPEAGWRLVRDPQGHGRPGP